jgi:hypothetical protein
MRHQIKRVLAQVGVTATVLGGLVAGTAAVAPSAFACGADKLCLHYRANTGGALYSRGSSQWILCQAGSPSPCNGTNCDTDVFNDGGSSDGWGKCVRNDAGSASNGSDHGQTVWYYVNYKGPSDYVQPFGYSNLPHTSNNDASVQFG